MLYANTAKGRRVPILDYTRREFRHRPPTSIQTLGSLAVLRALKWTPPAGRRWLSARSEVLKNLLMRDVTGFFSGSATYLAKLGPKAPHSSRWDRLAAGSVQSIESARRGYSVARLERDVLAQFASEGATALQMLNIGGGPANDNLNALLLWRSEDPDSFRRFFEKSSLTIRVLDTDSDGFQLGQNCLSVLRDTQGPLQGAAVKLDWVSYDWEKPESLGALLPGIQGSLQVTAEGSLFEYATDENIARHLTLLRTYAGPIAITGSVFRDRADISLIAKRMLGLSPQMGWQLRGLNGVRALAEKAGWTVTAEDTDNTIYATFTLRPR